MDKRHQRRILFLQALYANEFPPQSWEVEDFNFGEKTLEKVKAIQPFLAEYDAQIQTVAPERPIKDISKIDLNILRLILFERQTKNTPVKVLIDEGVELAKEFGNDHAFAFVNAVLEKLLITNAPSQAETETGETPKLITAEPSQELLEPPTSTPTLEAPASAPAITAPQTPELLPHSTT